MCSLLEEYSKTEFQRENFLVVRETLFCVLSMDPIMTQLIQLFSPQYNEITVHYYKLPIQKPFSQNLAQWVSFRELHHFQMHQFWSIFRSLANTILNFHAKTNGFFQYLNFRAQNGRNLQKHYAFLARTFNVSFFLFSNLLFGNFVFCTSVFLSIR